MRLAEAHERRTSEEAVVSEINYDAQEALNEPFDLCINVDTVGDLAFLWALFNMSGETLSAAAQKAATERRKSKGPFSRSFLALLQTDPSGKRGVWKKLNQHLKDEDIEVR